MIAESYLLPTVICGHRYDAYFIDCAIRQKSPLLTLDRKLKIAAQSLKVTTLEV